MPFSFFVELGGVGRCGELIRRGCKSEISTQPSYDYFCSQAASHLLKVLWKMRGLHVFYKQVPNETPQLMERFCAVSIPQKNNLALLESFINLVKIRK